MTYRGHVENGTIVLDEPLALPEGVTVKIEVSTDQTDAQEDTTLSFSERYAEVLGKARSLPEDAAENHDHYLYGVPKR